MSVTLTPPEVGRILRITPERVIAFILAGELEGFNVASRESSRPRYRITQEALEEFKRKKSGAVVSAPPKAKRRRRADRAGYRFYS